MPKIDLSESKKAFDLAVSFSNAVDRDQNDPASTNLMMSLQKYFESTAFSLIAIAKGIDALSDRLDKLEAKAGGLSPRLK